MPIKIQANFEKGTIACPICVGRMLWDRKGQLKSRNGWLTYHRYIHEVSENTTCHILDLRVCLKSG